MLCELACTDCNSSFTSAATLLQHFAEHASQVSGTDEINLIAEASDDHVSQTSSEPNTNDSLLTTENQDEVDVTSSPPTKNFKRSLTPEICNAELGIQDLTPLQYCAVTLTDNQGYLRKKYNCTFCLKSFGWSTDLKRHILIHTGEKPFQCSLCDARFTRKFLLQKHLSKLHGFREVKDAEDDGLKQKSRKQDKQSIKRNTNGSAAVTL